MRKKPSAVSRQREAQQRLAPDQEATEEKKPSAARESEMPRALVGWPEGSTYVPRKPVFFTDIFPAEVPSQMRRYRSRGKYERKAPTKTERKAAWAERGATGAAE